MFEGQERVNILQPVPTLRKLSSTKFTFVINCIFIWYKVKNILQARKYLSSQVKTYLNYPQHINIVFCKHYIINWSTNVLQGINIF